MLKAVLQNRMALDVLTAAQEGNVPLLKQNAAYTPQVIIKMSQDY